VTPQFRPVLVAAAAALVLSLPISRPASATSLAGNYLAAVQADLVNDYRAAEKYYTATLADDPTNSDLLQSTLLAYIGAGDIDKALVIAKRMQAAPASQSQLADLVALAENIRKGDFAAAAAAFQGGQGFSPLLDGLMQGWVAVGQGNMTGALAKFDDMASNKTMKIFSQYHKALALALAGDFGGAEKLLAGSNGKPIRIGRGSLVAQIEILSQLEQKDKAIGVIDQAMNGSGDLQLLSMKARLIKGETLPFTVVTNAKQGAAEVFLTLASVLSGQNSARFGLIYGRLAEYLRPHSVAAVLLVANILESQKQYDLAVENFNKVPSDNPRFYTAEIGRAGALQAAGKPDAAIEVLRGLTKTYKNVPTVFTSLGDALRRQGHFAKATKAYDAAIKLLPKPQQNQWFLYYARGITYERQGNWDKAEADFRFALKLSPDQPLVLNYLGYGLVEKGIKMEAAQKMIETAVKKRPDDGYITDSLGWVFYQVGKYSQAVPPLERAVELVPVDPVVNDHLGDAYWMVGRKLEARFQWSRALSFGPDDKEAARIRKKLKVGLDAVLKTEAKAKAQNN